MAVQTRCVFQIGGRKVSIASQAVVTVLSSFEMLSRDPRPVVSVPGTQAQTGELSVLLLWGSREATLQVDRILGMEEGEPASAALSDAVLPLNLDRLFEGVPESEVASQRAGPETLQSSSSRPSYLLARTSLGGLAIKAHQVIELLRGPEVKPQVLVTERCLGYVHRRGQVVPVFCVESEPPEKPEEALFRGTVIVLDSAEGSFGILVDSVERLQEISDESFSDHLWQGPEGHSWRHRDPLAVLGDLSVSQVIKGYQNIYPLRETENSGPRQALEGAYLEFQMSESFCLPLSEIHEIDSLRWVSGGRKPAGKAGLGYHDLHGKEIPVFDGRALYGLSEKSLDGSERVLVLKSQDHFYGVVVDSVQEILRIDPGTRQGLNPWLLNTFPKALQQDVTDFFHVLSARHDQALYLKVLDFKTARAQLQSLGSPADEVLALSQGS